MIDQYLVKNYNKLLSFTKGITSNVQDAEDILGDSIVKVLENKAQFDSATGEPGFLNWIYTIIINTKNDFYGSFNNKNFVPIDDANEIYDTSCIFYDDEINIFMDKLKEFDSYYYIIFYLSIVCNYKRKELADLLNITESKVKRYYLAVKSSFELGQPFVI